MCNDECTPDCGGWGCSGQRPVKKYTSTLSDRWGRWDQQERTAQWGRWDQQERTAQWDRWGLPGPMAWMAL